MPNGSKRVRVRTSQGRTSRERRENYRSQENQADGNDPLDAVDNPESAPKDGPETEAIPPEPQLPVLSAPEGGVPPIVEAPAQLQEVAEALDGSQGPIAVDTERAQGRTYGTGAYLIQLKREGGRTYLVDPRAFPDLDILAAPMRAEWILHAPDQDLAALAEVGLSPTSLFDTEIAARLLGARKFGLGALTESYLGVRLAKAHQNEDWSKRPLPEAWLSYAALDVELLPELRDLLAGKLRESGRFEWAMQEFDFELTHPAEQKPQTWRGIKGLGKVREPADLAVARELWQVREEMARKTDTAPGRILTPRAIVEASLVRPSKRRDVLRIQDFRRPLAKRNLDLWWEAIEKAYALSPDDYPSRPVSDPFEVPAAASWKRSDPAAFVRLTQVRELVSKAGEHLDLETEVVMNGRDQRFLAWWPLDRPVPQPGQARGKKVSLSGPSVFLETVDARLRESRARSWQREQFLAQVEQALGRGGSEVAALQAAEPRPPRNARR